MTKEKPVKLIDSVLPTSEAPVRTASQKQTAQEKLEKFMKEELRPVRGIFQFFECPGGFQRVQMRKYKGHFFDKTMWDGQEYEVPLYVARELNGIDITAEHINGKTNSCGYAVHGFLSQGNELPPSRLDAQGTPVPLTGPVKYKRRFGFQSLDFARAA